MCFWPTPSLCPLGTLTFLTPSDSTWVLGVRKWMLSTMTQMTTTMATSTMPKSRNLWQHADMEPLAGEASRCLLFPTPCGDSTHLPIRGMAMDVAGSRLEMSSRKTDWASSTEMAMDVFSPPGGARGPRGSPGNQGASMGVWSCSAQGF